MSARTRLRLHGRDCRRFLNNLCTAKLLDVPVGSGCESFFLDTKGHCIGHGAILVEADEILVESAAGQGPELVRHFEKVAGVEVRGRAQP